MKLKLKLVISLMVVGVILTNSVTSFAVDSYENTDQIAALGNNGETANDETGILSSNPETQYIAESDCIELETDEHFSDNVVSNGIEREIELSSVMMSSAPEFGETETSDDSTEDDSTGDNTDINNAYVITNGTVVQGTITTANEFRWYAFVLSETSKYSIWLQMVDTLDADLYIFQYDSSSGDVELIGGSATEGAGVSEYDTYVVSEGIYFVAVSGYESTGNFAFAYCESTADVSLELNDSQDTASTISLSTEITGVIDNPYDVDYYSITIEEPTLVRFTITTSDDYILGYLGTTTTAPVIPYASDEALIMMEAGTYTFAVYSPNYSYSTSSTYSVNFKEIGGYADFSVVPYLAINEEAGIVFQTNSKTQGTVCYVNGNLIDISYQYDYTASNSGGSQSYHISLQCLDGVVCQTSSSGDEPPQAEYYYSSSKPAKTVESKPLLNLMYYVTDTSIHFYTINCYCTGAYSENTYHQNPWYAIVLIDPDDGKLVDICDPNYFYDHAMGSNSLNTTQNYGEMVFYY